eukprot:scaffold536631_cov48-Prasinocladus_malaysianus.AAC.1
MAECRAVCKKLQAFWEFCVNSLWSERCILPVLLSCLVYCGDLAGRLKMAGRWLDSLKRWGTLPG